MVQYWWTFFKFILLYMNVHLMCTSVKFPRTDVCMDQSLYNIA